MNLRTALPALGLAPLLAVALAACTPTPPPAPSPSATPAATSSATPTPTADPEPVVATLVMRTETLALLDAEGATVETFSFLDDPGDAIDALTDAFGAEPAVTLSPGSLETPTATLYTWAGVVLWDLDYVNPGIAFPNFALIVETATLGGVAIETVGGVHVGSTPAEVSAIASQQYSFDGDATTEADPVLVDDEPGLPGAAAIVLITGTTDDPAQQITAPTRNYGN